MIGTGDILLIFGILFFLIIRLLWRLGSKKIVLANSLQPIFIAGV